MFIPKRFTRFLTNYNNDKSFGAKLRARRLAPLLQIIKDCYKEKGHVSIADIGGTKEYWNIVPIHFLQEHEVKITIINLPELPVPSSESIFNFVSSDACDLSCFEENCFDISHSNSVVEHVGDWTKMVKFANEAKRIAPKYFIQTPNFWFPVEPHCMTLFFHWLPRPTRIWLVMNFQLGHWSKASSIDQAVRLIESARLLNKKMMLELFEDASIKVERLLLLPKSFISIKK